MARKKYLTYLLKSAEVIQIWEFDNLHMTQCAKIIVGFMANVGNVFYPTFTNVFFCYFLHVFSVTLSNKLLKISVLEIGKIIHKLSNVKP